MLQHMPQLLSADCLIKTGPVDYAAWNYSKSVLSRIQRHRFVMAKSLFRPERYSKLLEIGYGSGIFMPELAIHANELHGVDVHNYPDQVSQALSSVGISAKLSKASAESIPYPDSHFDCIVAVSVMCFIPDINRACAEIRRVLQPGGHFIVIMPSVSSVVDLGLYLLTGNSAKEDFGDRREKVPLALSKCFQIEKTCSFPPIVSPRFYQGWRLI